LQLKCVLMDFVFEKLAWLEARLKNMRQKCKELKDEKGHLENEVARMRSELALLRAENKKLRALVSGRVLAGEGVGNGQMKSDARKKLDEMIDTINRVIESLKTDVGKS